MKKILMLVLCIASTFQLCHAQNYIHEFGKYSGEDFQLKNYDKDPTAEAVVIYDIGESYFTHDDEGFKVNFERKMKIKVLTKAGLKWAQVSIPYYVENTKVETIDAIKGNTYNLENGMVKTSVLDPQNSYNEKIDDHWFVKKIAMPDVKEGSVIEVSYRIISPYLFNLRSWEFQNKIPVIHSEYTVKMIPFYEYMSILQGAKSFDGYKTYKVNSASSPFQSIVYEDVATNFIMKDIPAFKDESYITSADDYIIKVDFQLSGIHYINGAKESISTTWSTLRDDMIDNPYFGKYMNTCKKKSTDLLDTMHISAKSKTEKLKLIDSFVKTNFNWDGHCDKFVSKTTKDFLTNKTGNCADINLFLAGMLNSAGIEAYPVILSTRSHGKIKSDYPFLHFFNYVVVLAKVDSSSVLIDATEPMCNYNEIPARCINDRGLIIQKGKIEWANLRSKSVSSITYNLDLRLTTGKDSIKQDCRLTYTGYDAISYRKKFGTSYKDLKTDLIGDNALPEDTLFATNLNQNEKLFRINFVKKVSAETIENKIIIKPFCNFTFTKNPLTQPTRDYPIDITYKKSNKFQSVITIPEGYKLSDRPTELKINNNLISIFFAVDTQIDGYVKVLGSYEFKKDIYDSTEYSEIKKYFDLIVDKFNEGLILKKEI